MSETQTTNDGQVIVINPETIALQNENEQLKSALSQAVMFRGDLQFQPYIDGPPFPSKEHLWAQACSGDAVTVESWLAQWISQIKENAAKHDFSQNAMSEFGKNEHKPCIVAGSGPNLRNLIPELKANRGGICLVSCLHNFGLFEDNGIVADYYVNLDAGQVTVPEMGESGSRPLEEYFEISKDRTLLFPVTSYPELADRWKGRKLWYNIVAPDQFYIDEMRKITDMNVVFSVGGNTLGACVYFAKAILGSNPITYIGAEFAFTYQKQFYGWKNGLTFGGVIPATDIYGNRVFTWPSYSNFAAYFNYIACGGKGNNPGLFINCSEAGILGAYPQGNIRQITQMRLSEFLRAYNLHRLLPDKLADKGQYWYLY